jgi:hypothetical protein
MKQRLVEVILYFSMAAKVIGKCEKNFIIRCLRDRQVKLINKRISLQNIFL